MESSITSISYFRPAAESATRTGGVSNAGLHESKGNQIDLEKVAFGVRMILEGLGEDPDREGLTDTPARVARMYQELVYGLNVNPGSEITCTFMEDTDELVLVKDIPFSSVCEHHLVPFIGSASIGYIPANGKITGLSKLARVVELASKKLQVQERMTSQIADAIQEQLSPAGVIVLLEAEHLCMSLRGIKKAGSRTLTTAMRGLIQSDKSVRQEIMSLLTRS
ncbi:MAG: GTP cyclohydrolase I FolE [Candidatus Obscuribacterales bacterium]|nr:GTP cyclohydrolase I FolE [Candidatus Obscuribacterales bacterium]